MDNIWVYGQHELDKDALLGYLQSNLDSYMNYNGYDEDQKQQFRNAVETIAEGIKNDTITGKGYNKFHDSTGTIQKNDTTSHAFGYVHTVANAMGKKFPKQKVASEEAPQKELFDYTKHGVLNNLVKSINPIASTNEDFGQAIQDYYNSFKGDNNALLSDVSNLFDRHIESLGNYDFADSERHIANIRTLQGGLKDGTIDDTDIRNFSQVGQRNFGIVLQNLLKSAQQDNQNTGKGFQGEGNKKNPFGHINWETAPQNNEELPSVPEGYKAEPDGKGGFNIIPEQEQVNWTGFQDYEKLRLLAVGTDILALINPEPISAATMGYGSDYLNYKADQIDPNLPEEEKGLNWKHGLNVALSTMGAIPVVGDIIGSGSKIAKGLTNIAPIINKWIGGIGMTVAAGAGISNYEELYKSAQKVITGQVSDLGVQDYQNIYQIIQLALGSANVYKSGKAQDEVHDILERNQIQDALVMDVKVGGKNKTVAFEGEEAALIKEYQKDPVAVQKYLNDNYDELKGVEVPSHYTSIKDRALSAVGKKPKEGAEQIVPMKNKNIVDNKAAREELSNLSYVKEGRTQAHGTWATSRGPEVLRPNKSKQNVEQGDQQTTNDSNEINIPPGRFDDRAEANAKENKSVEGKEPAKSEQTNEKSEKNIPEEKKVEEKKENLKATEIKPDNKSKAKEQANIQSEVAKASTSSIKARLKSFYKDKKDQDDIDHLISRIEAKQGGKGNSKQLARDVSKYGNGSKEYQEALRRLLASGVSENDAKKMLAVAGVFKKGGIIKAENGSPLKTNIPEWFNYKQQALTGWNKKLNKDKWTVQGVGFHTDADSLQSVFDANTNYTSDVIAIGNDIQNYQDQGGYKSTSDLINAYNKDANNINNFWNTDHTYNEDTGEHAPTFKKLFASRSSEGKLGDLNYNLGYQDDLQNIMGSTMWHRRMDWYEKKFDELSNIEKQNRIHAIKLGNGEYGYVYKKHDGTIAELDTNEAQRILNIESPNKGSISSLPYDPKTDTFDAGSLEEVVVTPNGSGNGSGNGQDHEGKLHEYEKTEIPKPEKPSNPFYTVDKALAVMNYMRAVGHNKEQLDIANRMVPLLYDPIEQHRNVYGNLGAIAEGQRQAAVLTNSAATPLTSDGSLQTATQLEAQNKARQLILQGWQSDNETMRKMSELAWQQEKENKENRYNIAMKNRENMHQVSKEKLMALMTKKRSDYESLTNHINEWRTWLTAKQKADENNANLLYSRRISNYVQNNPDKYIPNWKLYEDVWNRYNNGETLSAGEQRTVQQIQNHLADAYYNEIYGTNEYFGYGINRQPFEVQFKKKGGRLTKDQVNSIIKFLKESNNNYNKAIDRSVKGLYNHIKLQRKK